MKVITKSTREKQEQMLFYLKFGTVMLWIDGRLDGVQLPASLRSLPQVRLNFDYGFEAADIRILPDRVEATLSFDHKPFACIIPMTAVYMMVSSPTETGCLFPDSIPREMAELFVMPAGASKPAPDKDMGAAPTATLSPEPIPAATPEAASAGRLEHSAATALGQSQPQRSHLRVVK